MQKLREILTLRQLGNIIKLHIGELPYSQLEISDCFQLALVAHSRLHRLPAVANRAFIRFSGDNLLSALWADINYAVSSLIGLFLDVIQRLERRPTIITQIHY